MHFTHWGFERILISLWFKLTWIIVYIEKWTKFWLRVFEWRSKHHLFRQKALLSLNNSFTFNARDHIRSRKWKNYFLFWVFSSFLFELPLFPPFLIKLLWSFFLNVEEILVLIFYTEFSLMSLRTQKCHWIFSGLIWLMRMRKFWQSLSNVHIQRDLETCLVQWNLEYWALFLKN